MFTVNNVCVNCVCAVVWALCESLCESLCGCCVCCLELSIAGLGLKKCCVYFTATCPQPSCPLSPCGWGLERCTEKFFFIEKYYSKDFFFFFYMILFRAVQRLHFNCYILKEHLYCFTNKTS